MTEYKEHPGSFEELLDNSGKDCTEAFKDAMHPAFAIEKMNDFYIGDFEEEFPVLKDRPLTEGLKCVYIGVPIVAVLALGFIGFKIWKRSSSQ